MELRYFGTATMLLRLGDARFLTDPAFDPAGTRYDFGPWYTPRSWFASQKTYDTPPVPSDIDAFLVSHDQHADNFDHAARAFVAKSRAPVVTTVEGARRLAPPATSRMSMPGQALGLGDRARGLDVGATASIAGVSITATPARHGPAGSPQVDEVVGFLLEAPGQPTVWISGDTVMYPKLRAALSALRDANKRIDVALVHCGAVGFPAVPIMGKSLFTFDAAQAIDAMKLLDPGLVVPIHRDGWTHFRQPESALRTAFDDAGLGDRTRFLDLDGTLTL